MKRRRLETLLAGFANHRIAVCGDFFLDANIDSGAGWLALSSPGAGVADWIETGRHADKDGRAYLGVAWENEKGFAVQPLVGVGSVSSDRSDELSGALLDLLLEGAIPLGRSAGIRLFVRHQRPPGSDAFTVIALGLGFKVGWAGG